MDAGSTDGTVDYLMQSSEIHLRRDEQLIGQAQSLNRVFGSLRSKYVCWLSDDNVVQPGMLELAVSILEADSSIGMVALKVKDVTGHNTSLPYIGGFWPSGILTCNQGVLPTRLLQKLGGFDEEFRDYGIDADLTARVVLEGYKVVFTKKVAIHHYRDYESRTWIDHREREKRIAAGMRRYSCKYSQLINDRYDKERGLYPRILNVARHFYRATEAAHLPYRQQVNSFIQNCFFAFTARYVSLWDPILNLDKPYHLVQQFPGRVRMQSLQTTRTGKEDRSEN